MRDSLTSLPALGGCVLCFFFFFFNDTATTEIYTLSLHDAVPIASRFPLTPCPSHGIRSQEVAMRENSVPTIVCGGMPARSLAPMAGWVGETRGVLRSIRPAQRCDSKPNTATPGLVPT